MNNNQDPLQYLRQKLDITKNELTIAQKQLNNANAELEQAEAKAKQIAAAHPLAIMAHEHILVVGYTLILLNHELRQIDDELTQLKAGIDNKISRFEQFMANNLRLLNKLQKNSQDCAKWKTAIQKLQISLKDELGEFSDYYHLIHAALSELVTSKCKKIVKIADFRATLDHHMQQLLEEKNQLHENQRLQTLEENRALLLEKRAGNIREVQRYHHIIDNILAIENDEIVKPFRSKRDNARIYIHSMQQKKAALLFEIKMLLHPEQAANDVLIEIDDLPDNKTREQRSSRT